VTTSPTYDELPRDLSGAGSAWGLYGDEDSIGRLNLITPDIVRDAVDLVRRGATFGLDTPLWAFDPPLDSTRTTARHRVLRGGAGAVEDLDDVLDDYFPKLRASGTHSRISPLDPASFTMVDRLTTSLTEASIRSITGRATGS